MPLLYYWRGDNYRRDLDYGAGYHLNQGNPLLHEAALGDSVWAFTRAVDGRYALAAELIVSALTLNPPNYRYGRYRVWGDLRRSRYFLVDGQPDISVLIRGLAIKSGTGTLGRAFQGRAAVRAVSPADHQVLMAYADRIPAEPRARLVPEERLEALILSHDANAVRSLLRDEPSGLAQARREYLYKLSVQRKRQLVRELRERYDGRCQICSWSPRATYDAELCEAHHVRWLSRGGSDALENVVLLCPNHRRAVHATEAAFDYADTKFVFRDRAERLTVVRHDLVCDE
jgi:5-methylcytosine-specific restriction enzyme A